MEGRMYGMEGPKKTEPPLDPVDQLIQDLETAHTCAQRAINALYGPSAVKRSIWYRVALMRAQSLLIGLHMQELQRRSQRVDH